MLNLNPEHLLQFGIKAVQDLAESSHYLYVSIKAYDFQCIPPHDNVQGGVAFSFQPGIPRMGQAMRESLEKAWMEHTGVPVREPIGLDENDVKLGSVLVTKAVRKKLPEGEKSLSYSQNNKT